MKKLYTVMLMVVLSLTISNAAAYAGVVKADDDSYYNEVVRSQTPVILQFYAKWCGACKRVEPTVNQIARELDGKVKVVQMDVDKSPVTAGRFNVKSIPMFFYVVDGSVRSSVVGAYKKEALLDNLDLDAEKQE